MDTRVHFARQGPMTAMVVRGLLEAERLVHRLGGIAYERQDYATAPRLFQPLADQGHATAQFNLGAMYAEGLGLAQDYPEAARWCRKAADQGDAITQFNLGLMYAEGQGLPRDHTESGKWFRKAADQGDANAQANLGVMYANGLGVPEDLILSCMWLNLAAAQGSEDARSARDKLVSHMTPAQIAEAQRTAREWKPTK